MLALLALRINVGAKGKGGMRAPVCSRRRPAKYGCTLKFTKKSHDAFCDAQARYRGHLPAPSSTSARCPRLIQWVQPGIATPPLLHSINQSEGKNAGVGSATFRHFWQSGKAFATPFHSRTLPHSTTFTTVSCVNPFIPTNKYASQSQGKACFLFFRRRRRISYASPC